MYLLDTNIMIYAQKNRNLTLLKNLKSKNIEDLYISIFTVAEMIFGCKKSTNPTKNYTALLEFLLPFNVLSFEQIDCNTYGETRAHLELQGKPIGTIDTFIGSQAVSRNFTLVTNNWREFERIPNIKMEDWTIEDR